MWIEKIDLPAELQRVRAAFDKQLADALLNRTDLTHAQIEKEFSISNKVIRRVSRQFNISRRRTPERSAAATSSGSDVR
jgi:hypothetical protein